MNDFELLNGDCLEILPTLPAGSVDAIITDLPYGTTACAWDTVIPFGPMWEAVKHVLKPKGAFVTTASQPFTSALVMSNPKWFRDEWIWEKDRATRHLDANKRPLRAHENVIVFGKNSPMYFPQKTTGHTKPNMRGRGNGHLEQILRGGLLENKNTGDESRFPRSVIKFNVANCGEWGQHPTQKPVALYEYLVRTYTNAGEIVLDMCMGSGTTGVAAIQAGRKFIGIEKDAKYFEIAKRRISQAQPPLIL